MAKTFIGELILRFKDESSAGAKKSAADITGALGKIESAAKRLNEMPWGGKFTQQLDKLGASSKDLDKLKMAWNSLYADIETRNLSKALKKSELGNWKNATLQHFVQQQQAMRSELDKSEKKARSWSKNMKSMMEVGLVTMGAYTGAYMGGLVLKSGVKASADWEREKYRLAQTGYSAADQNAAISNAQALTMKYPQISGTENLELTKSAIAATGGVNEGIEIAKILARAQVIAQTQGKESNITGDMAKFTKGGELAGLIKPGPGGQERFKTALENWVKFSQIEGQYMSMADFFSMTRRAKGTFAGASDEFIALLPSLGVDMTAPGAGTALSSLNKAYTGNVGGGNGKHNFEEQKRIGIRDENGIVAADEYRANAFAWTQKYLIPALTKAGINVNDSGSVQGELAKLIGNANAAAVQGTMINQRASIQKSIDQRNGAEGTTTAENARYQDPYSGWQGFMNSLQNFAAALGEGGPMKSAVAGLNAMTDAINRMQDVWRNGGALGKMEVGGGLMAGGFAGYKLISGIYAIATAGPALNASAVALDGAAAALTEAAGVSAIGKGLPGKKGGAGSWAAWGLAGMAIGGIDSLFRPGDGLTGAPRTHWGVDDVLRRLIAVSGAGPGAGTPTSVLDAQRGGAGSNPLQSAIDHASALGGALNVKAKPMVDVSSIEAAIGKANQLVSILGVAQSAARASTNFDLPSTTGAGSVGREMNRNLADHGVVP